MFWTRFIELCNEAGKSPNAVAAACGVKSSGTVTGWRNGSIPRTPVLHKMADYFNVTADYLLGNVDLPFLSKDERGALDIDLYALTETRKPIPVSEDELRKLDENLIKRLVNLEPEEIAKVDAFVQGLLAARGD